MMSMMMIMFFFFYSLKSDRDVNVFQYVESDADEELLFNIP